MIDRLGLRHPSGLKVRRVQGEKFEVKGLRSEV
jgi:hypothetical protein